ncbi:MAG TPA: hydrogenase iron-sulfur subunit [bacterium (Candidatus Stahlbacteria)]|nr:hydrogenase iron-sulfur subunit [Candidatus Stahlbacteria bacterium]
MAQVMKITFLDEKTSYPIAEIEASSCRVACPAQVNIKAYLGFIARGEFEKALSIVRETNPLPGICGRVCTHPCESECRRGDYDDPVAICALKRFIADYELKHRKTKVKPIKKTKKEKIAIIGSGPAGLTCANDLIQMGYGVTIFEELPVAGGMLISGIPAYRLPRDIIHAEIEDIVRLGVKIKTNTKIEDPVALLKRGFQSVFIAIGAHKGLKLKIPGEDELKGVVDCIGFLRMVNLGKRKKKPGRKVVVIGGGNSAIDSARSALRLGSDEVTIVYRRSRQEMPANEAEIEAAIAEGVEIHYLATPVRVLGKAGKVTGLECVRMRLGEPDASGRRRPIPIEDSEFTIECDYVIPAISQKPDLTGLKISDLKITKWGTFGVDEDTLNTNIPGIFAGGDAVTGPNTVIDAIAAGHTAARSIDRFLRGLPLITEEEKRFKELEVTLEEIVPEKASRINPKAMLVSKRRRSFDEVEKTLSEDEAMKEAKRCLRCGPCLDCISCIEDCKKRLVGIVSKSGRTMMRLPYLPQDILNAESWSGRITVKGKKAEEVEIIPIVPDVEEFLCRGCGKCESVCRYEAVKVVETESGVMVARVDRTRCRGCGVCGAICPTSAIGIRFFEDRVITDIRPEEAVIYLCHWSGFPAFQSAEARGFNLPKGAHPIHLICLGRLGIGHLLKPFEEGAKGVLLVGCPIEECHYINGNIKAKEIFDATKALIRQLGIGPERLRFEMIRPEDWEGLIKIVDEFLKAVVARPGSSRKSR